jgi:hypothetical protein
MRWPILALAVVLTWTSAVSANEPFDWSSWRELPVQNGGRRKPLDTLARETLRTIANRGRFADPRTHRNLDPVELYLTMLFE